METNATRLLRPKTVGERLGGIKRTALNGRVVAGLLTTPIAPNSRVNLWPEAEVERVAQAYAAGLDDTAIKALVVRLHSARARAASALLAA